jgi:hypothetical protein
VRGAPAIGLGDDLLAACADAAILGRMQALVNRYRYWLVVAASAGVLAWTAGGRPLPQAPSETRPSTAAPADVAPAAAVRSALDTAAPTTPAYAPDLPPGVTQAQWLALREELRARPDGDAELRRIGDYLAWSDTVRRLRAAQGDAAERLQLARALDAGLSARLREGEVTSAEARQIKIALLEVTLKDPAERAAALQRWIATEMSPATADPRQVDFDRRQASVVAAWNARPPGARDAAGLERELEALRREVFGTKSPATR